jgi:hypothetical protein
MWLAGRQVEGLGAAALLQATVPHTDLFVSAIPTPNPHGQTFGRAEGEPLREPATSDGPSNASGGASNAPGGASGGSGEAQGAPLERRRHRLRVVNRILMATLVAVWSVVFYAYGREPVRRSAEAVANDATSRRITATHWPERDWSTWHPLPAESDAIDRADERQYFRSLVPLLEAGANNRLNMQAALRATRAAEEYRALHHVYRQRQTALLAQLGELAAPARLHGVHGHIVVATEQQLVFFDAFVGAKVKDPAVDLSRMLDHAAGVMASRALRAAWNEVRALYPTLDPATGDAIERRLDHLDAL